MRRHFFGYYEMTPEQFEKLWKDCVFVVDTNVLLDMYRLSANARDALFQTLSLLKNRLWIPYQVAFEYHKEITSVLLAQIKKCDEMITDSSHMVNKILEGCQATRNFPYLSEQLQERIRQVAQDIETEVDAEKTELEELINSNPTQDKIAELLEGRLWDKLQEDRLSIIYNEGRRRYDQKIPPGYGDMKEKQGNDMFGDLVIWEEMIAFAVKNKKDVIFISSDTNKDDWFIKVGNKLKGPRAELRMEFAERTEGRVYYAYPTSLFLTRAGDYIKAPKVSDAIIEEVASMVLENNEAESSMERSILYASASGATVSDYDQTEDSSPSES